VHVKLTFKNGHPPIPILIRKKKKKTLKSDR